MGLFSAVLVASLLPLAVPSGDSAQATNSDLCENRFPPSLPEAENGIRLISEPKHLTFLSMVAADADGALNEFYRLTADVDLDRCEWTPIISFRGVFDGNNKTISGLNILENPAPERPRGLFSVLDGGGIIKDLTLNNPNLSLDSNQPVGIVVGRLDDGSVSGISVVPTDLVDTVPLIGLDNSGGDPPEPDQEETCSRVFRPLPPPTDDAGRRVVSDPGHLVWLSASSEIDGEQFGAKIILANDIDLEQCKWSPIFQPGRQVRGDPVPEGFYGVFDGGGYTIRGLALLSGEPLGDDDEPTPLGFFGLVGGEASVRNVTFESPTITLRHISFTDVPPTHDAIGIVIGKTGEQPDSSPEFSDITIVDGDISLDCQTPNGCVVENVGGVIGNAESGTFTRVSAGVSMSFTGLNQAGNNNGPGPTVFVPPGDTEIINAGLFAGLLGEESESIQIRTSGTIESALSVLQMGGIAGQINGGIIRQAKSTVDILIGGSEDGRFVEINRAAEIAGSIGKLSNATAEELSASGSVVVNAAGSQSKDPPKQSIRAIGGLVGFVIDNSSISDSENDVAITVRVFDVGERDPDVTVNGVGGFVGEVLGNPEVLTSLARSTIDTGEIASSTEVERLGAFLGAARNNSSLTTTASFWSSQDLVGLDSSAGSPKTRAELNNLATFEDWSIVSGWNPQGDARWGICSGTGPGFPFLQWLPQSDPCIAPAGASPPSSFSPSTNRNSGSGEGLLIGISAKVGDQVAGSTAWFSGENLKPGSSVFTEVRSAPTVLSASQVDATGRIFLASTLPQLHVGVHRFIGYATDSNGADWSITINFGVDEMGRFSWIGAASVGQASSLARTGPAFSPLSIAQSGIIALFFGVLLLGFARWQRLPRLHSNKSPREN